MDDHVMLTTNAEGQHFIKLPVRRRAILGFDEGWGEEC